MGRLAFTLVSSILLLTFCQTAEIKSKLKCDGAGFRPKECPEGLLCYRKDKFYSECRNSCPSDWECNLVIEYTIEGTTSAYYTEVPFYVYEDDDDSNETHNFENNSPTTISNNIESPKTVKINFDEFTDAVASNGYPKPAQKQYDMFIKNLEPAGGIDSKREAAMFLAQIIWESNGLVDKKEIACKDNGCPGSYTTGIGPAGKNYYGRGYIQLSWDYNYRDASQDLFGDDRLLTNPDQVADNEDISWSTSFWFWKDHVMRRKYNKKVKALGQFGTTTMFINGGLECKGPYKEKAKKRFDIYKKVLKAFALNDQEANEIGCYN